MGLFNWGGGGGSKTTETESMRRKREFCALLDRRGMHYRDGGDGDEAGVFMPYGGGDFCFDSLVCHIDFDPTSNGKGNSVQLFVPCVRNFSGAARARGLAVCNSIMKQKRWVRPYIDKDGDLDFDLDMFISGSSAAEDVLRLVQITMSIIDDVYMEIQRA